MRPRCCRSHGRSAVFDASLLLILVPLLPLWRQRPVAVLLAAWQCPTPAEYPPLLAFVTSPLSLWRLLSKARLDLGPTDRTDQMEGRGNGRWAGPVVRAPQLPASVLSLALPDWPAGATVLSNVETQSTDDC